MMLKKILVPLDGSELAERALPYACSLAKKYEAELIVLMVLQLPPTYVLTDEMGVGVNYLLLQEGLTSERERAETYLSQLDAKLKAEKMAPRMIVVDHTSVAEGIVNVASDERVDVIVKTTHGRSGPSRWVYGNVATKVLQSAPCPVFLVRVQ